ncbi:hypothetical protein BT96DRAFT_1100530, partial [Gymnopus androsaceus JB14]
MPTPRRDWGVMGENRLIADQLNYNCDDERTMAEIRVAQLNQEQLSAYSTILHRVKDKEAVGNNLFFLDGPGGTGKTFVYITLCHALRGEGSVVLCVASTGIAALILPGGRTAHSMLKIPIDGLNGSTCDVSKNSYRGELMRMAKLII